MTRQEILMTNLVRENGIIYSPGKFEGEMLYVPYFYDQWNLGMATEDYGKVAFFEFEERDFREFPELNGFYGIALEETESGFVNSAIYKTKEEFDLAMETERQIWAAEDEEESD